MSVRPALEMNHIIKWGHVITFEPIVSAANREGVEGEPQATLGGRPGSPRTGQWCRHCGSVANPSSDSCVPCWSAHMNNTMEVGGMEAGGAMTKEFIEVFDQLIEATTAVADTFESTPSLQQSLDPAIP